MSKTARKLTCKVPVPSDIEIAHAVKPLPITEIAAGCGILPGELNQYGPWQAKVSLDVLKRMKDAKRGKYVVVAGINPTPLGEGKSTTMIGLAQALGAHLGRPSMACMRQPSQGPTFGVKGGAAGGGYSQVIPMEDFNLHGTGDIHAISAANNLLAAAIDARVFHERSQDDEHLYSRLTAGLKNFFPTQQRYLRKLGIDKTNPKDLTPEERRRFARLDIDPDTISWRRVVDVNDRFLRDITIGQGKAEKGWVRRTGYDISVASEAMAVLALAEDLADMRRRLGNMQVAYSTSGTPVTAEDIGAAGAMTVLMRQTIEPTLMQTIEGTPCLVHAGPFANIAHGNSSVVADKIALRLVGEKGFVITEGGFGADMGVEKLFNIKCRSSGLKPDCAVVVATVRAIKFHGGVAPGDAGKPNMEAVKTGIANLVRHVQNLRKFNVPVVVYLNKFTGDLPEEIQMIVDLAKQEGGAFDVVTADNWAQGGAGAVEAAEAITRACDSNQADFKMLYPSEMPLKQKIDTIAKEIYGAAGVELLNDVEAKLAKFESLGYGKFPICMAKTQYSFSHDPNLKGAPSGFTIPIRDVRVSCGAEFVFPLLADISTMPGLPTRPSYMGIDVDENGTVVGLS